VDIAGWLTTLGLADYAQAFADNHIDEETLRELTADDLKDVGVVSVGHRKKLLAAIAKLAEEATGETPGDAPSEPRDLQGERRQVTVLFADLSGFTKLSSELGAEKTHALLNRFFQTADAVVESYGGRIDKHIGDNVMAVFGAPVAHSDDPERALRAALEIHRRTGELGVELGIPMRVHIGVASGQVVASGTGSDAHREYTVTGESVNLASRLQDQAGPGETLVSGTVHRHVEGLFASESLGEIEVKGFTRPIAVWRVDRMIGAGEERGLLPLIGRRRELAQFTSVIETCQSTGQGQSLLLRGEAGIGKSRLVAEFAERARAQGYAVHKGLVLDFGAGKGQDAVRSLVRSLLALGSGSGGNERQAVAEDVIASGRLNPEDQVFLNDLLDLPQPTELHAIYDAMDNQTRNQHKRDVVTRLVAGTSARLPLLLVIENIHWADRLTLAHLAALAVTVADCPAILVMTARIEDDPLDQAWRGTIQGSPLITLDLGPLREDEAIELASGFIGAMSRYAKNCIARAEGNPLFLEQLLRDAEESEDEEVPASIQSLVLARMDRLGPKDRRALQAAAIIGQRFSSELLRHLLGDPDYSCDRLAEHYLVRQEDSDYLFAHALICDGAYSSLLTAQAQELHRSAAEFFAGRDPLLHAQHLDRAEDATAPAAYLAAARSEAEAYRSERAMQLVDRGLELASDGRDRIELSLLKGRLLHDLGSMSESIAVYEQALSLAEAAKDRCRAHIGIAGGLRVLDRFDDAFQALAQAESAAEPEQLVLELSQIHHLRGNLSFPLGRLTACLEEHERALDFARQAASPACEARALGGLGDANYAIGLMATAREYFGQCIELSRAHGFGGIEVANLPMLGQTLYFLGNLESATEFAQTAIEFAQRSGLHRAELVARRVVINATFETGQADLVVSHIKRTRELAEHLGAQRFEPLILMMEARVQASRGQNAKAEENLERAYESCQALGVRFAGAMILGHLALFARTEDKRRRALSEGEAVLSKGGVSHNHLFFYRDAIETALELQDWSEVERFAAALEDYTGKQPLRWSDFYIARGRVLAAFGRGRRDSATAVALKKQLDDARSLGLNTAVPALEEACAQTP
jgi:class 3 adenylate cyclase/tetratricopeptide (TPR) repeat protein